MHLSNFDIQNVNEMDYMFDRCDSLKLENIIVKDKNIFDYFSE